ncbi:MAG: peptidase M48 [Methanobrevibacter thaueri]|nr:peptidase M48 [Methanobrevibacter thaueri]
MAKDDRSPVNPFTGKQHYDVIDDDEFLKICYQEYYEDIQKYELLDDAYYGQLISNVALKLIKTVEDFLIKIDRYDYVEDYYDWEFHLVKNDTPNAGCFPGGKIVVYSGLFQIADSEEKIAFILAHEMAHALLDHTRTKFSVQQTKDTLTTVSWVGSFALDLMGFKNAGAMTRAAVNLVDIGSHFFLTQPWGRDQELEADKLGMIIIHLAGYDVSGVPDFWDEFSNISNNTFDFFTTHPSDDKRIAVMRESLDEILLETDFYSKPVLPETPVPKNEYMDNGEGSVGIPMDTSSSGEVATAFTTPHQSDSLVNETCPECGSVVGSGAKFCTVCGCKIERFNPLACPECGYITNPGDNFCKGCGFKMVEDLYCSNCGEVVVKGQLFCTGCGNRLD